MSDMIDNNKTRTLTLEEYKNFQKFVMTLPNHTGYMVEHINEHFKVSFLREATFCWDTFFNYNDGNIHGVS